MMDSRLPWLAAIAGSRTDLDAGGSSTALYSIYGSQVSQLPIASEDLYSNTNSNDDSWYSSSTPSLLSRPKSAPPKSWQRQRITSARPRPSTVSPPVVTTISKRKLSRPTSAYPAPANNSLRRGTPQRSTATRPSTAQPLRRPLSAAAAHVPTQGPIQRMKEVTVPVALTSVPQYFNFWKEKPLLTKDWDVTLHQRRSRRPRSDYGTRFYITRRKSETDKGCGQKFSETTELGTLLEDDDSNFSDDSHGGSRKKRGHLEDEGGGEGEGGRGRGGGDSDEEGNKDGQNHIGGLDNDNIGQDGSTISRLLGETDHDKIDAFNKEDRDREFERLHGQYDDNNADEEDFFKKKSLIKTSTGNFDWLDSITGASSMTTRFELPMDLLELQNMSPTQYLTHHCVISYQRRSRYSKVFSKLKQFNSTTISGKDIIIKGLIDAHHQCITKEQAEDILEIVQMLPDQLIHLQLFGAMCALTERIFGPLCLPFHLQKELIEVVDFEALDWKLRGCCIKEPLRKLFAQL